MMTEVEIIQIKKDWLWKRALILNRIYGVLLFPQSTDFSEYNDIQALADEVESASPDLAQKMRDDLAHLITSFRQLLNIKFRLSSLN